MNEYNFVRDTHAEYSSTFISLSGLSTSVALPDVTFLFEFVFFQAFFLRHKRCHLTVNLYANDFGTIQDF